MQEWRCSLPLKNNRSGKYRYLIYLLFSGIMALNQIIRFIPSVSFPVVLVYRISFMVLFIVMITGLFGLTKLKFVDMLFLLCGTYILLINLINGVGMVDSLVSICWPFAFIFGEKMADSQCYNRFKKIRLISYFLFI